MYLPTPMHDQDAMQGWFFKPEYNRFEFRISYSYTGCHTKVKTLIAGGIIIGFIFLSRVLMLREMETVSFRFWTRVAARLMYVLKLWIKILL